jgi:hypothetical protein
MGYETWGSKQGFERASFCVRHDNEKLLQPAPPTLFLLLGLATTSFAATAAAAPISACLAMAFLLLLFGSARRKASFLGAPLLVSKGLEEDHGSGDIFQREREHNAERRPGVDAFFFIFFQGEPIRIVIGGGGDGRRSSRRG